MEGIATDVTERKFSEERLAAAARTDQLTSLPNRSAFLDRIRTEFSEATRSGKRFAVLYFDLDYFKDVNDSMGHAVGDMLLRAVSARLLANVRAQDFVARLGGDEFAVLRGGVADEATASTLASTLLAACAAPYRLAGRDVQITVSAGITLYDETAASSDDILTRTDLALYRAKAAGRNRYAFHSEEMDLAVRERVGLTADLRSAFAAGDQLYVMYQPQVEIETGRIVGVEALVRWQHPTRGLLSPDVFIPAAESSGLIGPLGTWVLRTACRQMRQWLDQNIAPPVMAVNLSVAQLTLNDEFDGLVGQVIKENNLSPGDLELELTESTLMETTREHRTILEKLRKKGARLSIDDFGTGYSSLDYLRSYAVSRIKIAQKFVDGIPDDTGSATIVRATLGLAHAFGIEVIAEGVESTPQAEFLTAIGCRLAQGYLFSKPLMSRDATAYLLKTAAQHLAAKV
jgi:diguanylate cyclase (GGDEF)-like protein